MTRNEAKDRVVEAVAAAHKRLAEIRTNYGEQYPVNELGGHIEALCGWLDSTPDSEGGWRQELGFGEIVMMSEQRNKPGLPPRWCALARGRKESAYADSEENARIAALALPAPPSQEKP